jgi:hypothetical protein
MDAATFFSQVSGCRDRVKVKRQKEYCQEQQQADQAKTPAGVPFSTRRSHKVLNTQVCFLCKAPNPKPDRQSLRVERTL